MQKIDHVAVGTSQLTDKLQRQDIISMLELFLERFQAIEEQYLELGNQKSIDIASGIWLDYIGKIISVSRSGMTDEDYRVALKFKVAVNTADGTPNIMISLIRQMTNSSRVRLAESGIAFGTIYLNGEDNISQKLFQLVKDIKPVATRWILQSDINDNSLLLAYENNSAREEVFQTTDNGVFFENFEVTVDGITFEPMFTITEAQSYHQASLIEGRNHLAYETPLTFQTTNDGNTFEDFETATPYLANSILGVITPYLSEYHIPNVIPFTWEVTEDSKLITNTG